MKIQLFKEINTHSGYIVIPFLESYYKTRGESVYKMLSNVVELDVKYREMCDKIDVKMRDKLVNIATMTISRTTRVSKASNTNDISDTSDTSNTRSIYSAGKSSKKDSRKIKKTKKNISGNNSLGDLNQIYLIKINELNQNDVANNLCEELRVAGHLIYNLMKNNYVRNYNLIPLLGSHSTEKERINCILEGIMLSSYKFDKYKTSKALDKKELSYQLENIDLIANGKRINSKKHELDRLNIIVKSVFLARDLVNEPANDNRVARFMARVKEFIKTMKSPVELEIWNKAQLEKMGMGLILGVGKGSQPENEPHMLVIKYNPSNMDSGSARDNNDKPEWVLLGKGITFDTGGLDLKKGKDMLEMKSDLSGAAAVVSFLLGYAASGGSQCIYVMCPFAENSISSSAVRPSDVLRAYDGRTVEVVDTDAEGRLVLADAIAYIVTKWPTAKIMDLATLTGQAENVSGKAFSCILSSNAEKETMELINKSNIINESLVRLPLLEKELSKLESNVADIKNVSYKSSADIILSSLFIKQFIKPQTKWIHIDIAGPSFNANEIIKYASPEASGVGVRLLFEYFSK